MSDPHTPSLSDVPGLLYPAATIALLATSCTLPTPLLPLNPHPSLSDVPGLLYPAATIALLAAIESLLCARVADSMIDDKHDSNTELISQVGKGWTGDGQVGWSKPWEAGGGRREAFVEGGWRAANGLERALTRQLPNWARHCPCSLLPCLPRG